MSPSSEKHWQSARKRHLFPMMTFLQHRLLQNSTPSRIPSFWTQLTQLRLEKTSKLSKMCRRPTWLHQKKALRKLARTGITIVFI